MGWKTLHPFSRTKLKEMVKLSKSRLERLEGDTTGAVKNEGIGFAYAKGKLHVGYITQPTANDEILSYVSLADVKEVTLKIQSKSVVKIEEFIYRTVVSSLYPYDLTQKEQLTTFVEDVLKLPINTNKYKACYVKQLNTLCIATYSPRLDDQVILAQIEYRPATGRVYILVGDGVYSGSVKPNSKEDINNFNVQLFEDRVNDESHKVRADAVNYLLEQIDESKYTISYDSMDSSVKIEETATGQVRLKGYVLYNKGFGTSYEYRLTYLEYYPYGTKHTHVKTYRVTVKDPKSFNDVVSSFTQNLK